MPENISIILFGFIGWMVLLSCHKPLSIYKDNVVPGVSIDIKVSETDRVGGGDSISLEFDLE